MIKRAVFVGAGASRAFGYPLTDEIMPEIKRKLRSADGLFEDEKADVQLRDYLQRMFPGWKTRSIPSIMEVLSLIDYSLLSNTAPILRSGSEELTEFRRLLERAVYSVINNVFFKGSREPVCNRFVDWLVAEDTTTTLITTNYDLELDTALFDRFSANGREEAKVKRGFDFGFSWRDPGKNVLHQRPVDPIFRLYKLHGSLNWLRCDLCEHTYVNIYGPIGHQAFKSKLSDVNTCDCEHGRLSLVLVTPSLVRDIRNVDILQTWQSAIEALRTADEWVIVGYSLPTEDLAIKSMFLRAYQGRDGRDAPRVTVVSYKPDKKTVNRFTSLFPNCKWHKNGVEKFV